MRTQQSESGNEQQFKAENDGEIVPIPFYKKRAFIYLSIACAALLVTGIAAMFHKNYPNVSFKNLAAEFVTHDIPPGGNRATLMLADGKSIILNEAADGELIKEAGTVVRKTGNGQLVYEAVAGDNDCTGYTYNTISTPKGGTYQITLPDGTKVWLNAASSLKFPTSFVSLSERRIELSGEAYFEVTKDARHPFKVITVKEEEVRVLGTHFNISSYVDDPFMKTTLFKGIVKVSKATLKPGQQFIINQGLVNIVKVDPEEVLAWKNGLFIFENEPLEHIMKKISRWYDVDVVYEGVDKNKLFSGKASRFENASMALKQLELNGGIHFKIEVGKIIVMR